MKAISTPAPELGLRHCAHCVLSLLFATLTLLFVAAEAHSKPAAADFWGLQTAGMLSNPFYAEDETDAMAVLGIHTVRMTIPWDLVQQGDGTCGGGPASGSAGERNWSALDARVLNAAKDGIKILANLGARRQFTEGGKGCAGYQTPGTEYTEYVEPYTGFVSQVVARYGVNGSFWKAGNPGAGYGAYAISVWEVANEENYSLFAPAGGPDAKGYAQYLVDTAIAVRAVESEATVLLGGLAPYAAAVNPTTFMKEMYEGAGGGGYTTSELDWAYNGVSFHPYSLTDNHGYAGDPKYGEHSKEVLAKVESLRDYLDNNGDANKTLWLTEVGWPVAAAGTFSFTYSETETQQARDLWETFRLLENNADALKVKYVGWYLFEDRQCPESGCGWDDLAGLRTYYPGHVDRYSRCAYSHLTGANVCSFVPKEGFETKTTISSPVPQNGQPGKVSVTGTANVTNIAGEPVTNLKVNVNFSKKVGGNWEYKNTAQVTVTNGTFSVSNWSVGVGEWRVKAVFFEQGNFKESETGWHEFSISPSGCTTETFITPGTPVNGSPGNISVTGHVNTTNPECGVVNGQKVNVNFAKKEGGNWVYKNTAQPTVVNGSYSVSKWSVGVGEWRVKAVFLPQSYFNGSETVWHYFNIAKK